MADSGHIIFHFKMNLIFVETFLQKSIYFTNKKKRKLFINLLWQGSTTTPLHMAFIGFVTKTLSRLFCNVMKMSIRRPIKAFFLAASKFIRNSKRLNECLFETWYFFFLYFKLILLLFYFFWELWSIITLVFFCPFPENEKM